MQRSSGRRTAPAVAAVLVVAALAVGCRPVQVTGTALTGQRGHPLRPHHSRSPAARPSGTHPPRPSTTTAPRPHAHRPPRTTGRQAAHGGRLTRCAGPRTPGATGPAGPFRPRPDGLLRLDRPPPRSAPSSKRQGLPRTGAVQPTAWRALKSQTRQPSHQRALPAHDEAGRRPRPALYAGQGDLHQQAEQHPHLDGRRRDRLGDGCPLRLAVHPHPRGRLRPHLQESATTSRRSTTRPCRTRCSSAAARPSTTPRTSPPAATAAPPTAASTSATRRRSPPSSTP